MRKAVFFRIYSLRARIIMAIFLVALLAMLLAGVMSSRNLKQEIDQAVSREIKATLSTCELFFSNQANLLEAKTRNMAIDNTLRTTLRFGVLPQLNEYLLTLRQYHNLDFIQIFSPEGLLLASSPTTSRLDKNHPLLRRALRGENATAFQNKVASESPNPVKIIPQRNPAPLLRLESAAPLKVRDQTIGILLCGFALNQNQHIMQELIEIAGSDALALVAGHQVICHNRAEICGNHSLESLIDYADPDTLVISKGPLYCPAFGKHFNYGYFFLYNGDHQRLGALISLTDADRKTEKINQAMVSMLIIFGGSLLPALILALILANSIARPLEKLSQATVNLAKGELQTRVSLGRQDEIGNLGKAFNLMAARISDQVENLNHEIIARRDTENELAMEKERLRVTLESIADGVITVDNQDQIVFMNAAAKEILQLPQADTFGNQLDRVLPLADPHSPHSEEPAIGFPEKQRKNSREAKIQIGGREIIISYATSTIVNQDQATGKVVVFRDITEKTALQNELMKTQKLESLSILAGGLAHDFNNLLTAIMGNISLALISNEQLPKKTMEMLKSAETASLRAREITRQLMAFARGGDPVKEIASVEEIIRESAEFCLRGSNCRCVFDFPESLPHCEIDKGQFSQVINNLIINASHAMTNGGLIHISLTVPALGDRLPPILLPGDYLKITVSDQGHGIPDTIREKIFDPFFTTKKKGSGLGLASSYSIIRSHNGYIGIASSSSRGTTFEIYLPASHKRADKDEKTPVRIHQGAGRILLLDDEELICQATGDILRHLGYETDTVTDGEEAVRAFERAKNEGRPYDLLIFDLTIPGGISGSEALKQILARNPEARAVVSSGYANSPVMANYRDYGFIDRISKPYTAGRISEVLDRCLGGTGKS